jgi:hypothetical protein
MTSWDHYRSRAFWCLETAQNTTDRIKKGRFIELALDYLRLAEMALKNNQTNIGCETLPDASDKSRRDRI